MTSEDTAGGGIENSRHIGRTTSQPDAKNDSIQEEEVKPRLQDAADETKQPFQESPRQYHESHSPSATYSPAPCRVSSNERISALEPPVTKTTLSELDVNKIISNPKLRHDINFDADLHFRPNIDGDKGRLKQNKANRFWNALHDQLVEFLLDRPSFETKYGVDSNWCLPQLLRAVKEIILTLVPQRDRAHLEDGLNIELLMQQFNHGVADLQKLAVWLSKVLKSHCAPMRDEWVNEMYNQLSNGDRNNDIAELVQGMRSLLSVLEAMKLDVANHQIRCLRPALIEDTVAFEQKYFYKKIHHRKLNVTLAKQWFQHAAHGSTNATSNMSVFFEAMSRLVLPSAADVATPNTFLFDEERIMKLRSDMADAIHLEICMRMYEDLERISVTTNTMPSLSMPRGASESDVVAMSRPSSWTLDGSTSLSSDSASSSPRSSVGLPPPPPSSGASLHSDKGQTLYNSLVSLLQSAPPTSRPAVRWQSISPAMALQIFRYTNAPSGLLPTFEAQLMSHLSDTTTAMYREVETMMRKRLLRDLSKRVSEFRNLSGVNLFAVATSSRTTQAAAAATQQLSGVPSETVATRGDDAVWDIATRMAHIGLLHWKVWGPLVYLVPDSPQESPLPI